MHTLINTHFHWDHWQGNEVYAAATANLEIISSARTQENLLTPGAGVGGVPYIAPQLAALPTEIAQLKDEIRRASSPELKARLETNLHTEAYFAELQQLTPALPTRTVASSVTLHEHGRELQLLLLGRAHTDGDLFIYLPQEKVIVTGDAVVDWMPFLGDGYPEEWIETLNALEQVDFTHMIPGHGDVLTREHIAFLRSYLTDLIAGSSTPQRRGPAWRTCSAASPSNWPRQNTKHGMSKYPLGQYRDRIGTNIEAVYQKVVKKD